MSNIQFWKDKAKKIPNARLFSEIAEARAKAISKRESKQQNKYSQIRKFYDEVIRINTLAQQKGGMQTSWDHLLPMIHMLSAKAAYASGRNLISDGFYEDIKNCVSQVDDVSDLNIFSNYFEAFMGFYKLHGPKD